MEAGPPALGVRSLSHWTTREVPQSFLDQIIQPHLRAHATPSSLRFLSCLVFFYSILPCSFFCLFGFSLSGSVLASSTPLALQHWVLRYHTLISPSEFFLGNIWVFTFASMLLSAGSSVSFRFISKCLPGLGLTPEFNFGRRKQFFSKLKQFVSHKYDASFLTFYYCHSANY